MKIKYLIIPALIVFGILTSCNNDDDTTTPTFESTAMIWGLDLTLCGCCGGQVIDIDEDQLDKRFTELPANSGIDLVNSTFPIAVRLNWSNSNEYCDKGITVEAIELIE